VSTSVYDGCRRSYHRRSLYHKVFENRLEMSEKKREDYRLLTGEVFLKGEALLKELK